MSCFKVSYFLDNIDTIPPFVLGAFVSRSILKDNYIYTECAFKSSKYSAMNITDYKNIYLDKLNKVSAPFVWNLNNPGSSSFKAKLSLENDLNISKERFFSALYFNIARNSPWINSKYLDENKKSFIRGFMETRGSIDTKRNYISQDYYYGDAFETKKYKLLTDFCNVPYYVLNLNFRELQKQYYDGTNKRNPQFRLHSTWYMKYIGMLNDYKIDIFANAFMCKNKIYTLGLVSFFDLEEPEYNINSGVDDYLNFYVYNILKKELDDKKINELRKKLGYESDTKQKRDTSLVNLIKELEADECVCCKDLYDIKDRSFISKKTNRPYFEVHHVISLGDEKELDDENNMVKLCPTCHRCLKKNTGLEEDQKRLISNILKNAPKTLEFCKKMFNCDDINEIIEKVFSNLN